MNPDDRADATLAELTAGRYEEAIARFAVLKPHLEDGVPLMQAAGAAGVSVIIEMKTHLQFLFHEDQDGSPRTPLSSRAP